jgi:putative SOS response-associated peptidase YedK
MGARALVPMRWGLIPSWWSQPLKEMKLATFNARVETVTEKPMFRNAFSATGDTLTTRSLTTQ